MDAAANMLLGSMSDNIVIVAVLLAVVCVFI